MIGVNTAINVQAHKIGYAIPINMVRELLPRLIGQGHIERAAMGAVISSLKPVDMPRIGIDSLKGALVRQVTEGGPGARAGLAVDDVILEFNGREIPGPWALRWAMSLAGVGSVVKLVVRRVAGQHQELRCGSATSRICRSSPKRKRSRSAQPCAARGEPVAARARLALVGVVGGGLVQIEDLGVARRSCASRSG